MGSVAALRQWIFAPRLAMPSNSQLEPLTSPDAKPSALQSRRLWFSLCVGVQFIGPGLSYSHAS